MERYSEIYFYQRGPSSARTLSGHSEWASQSTNFLAPAVRSPLRACYFSSAPTAPDTFATLIALELARGDLSHNGCMNLHPPLAPMEAQLVDEIPVGPHWQYEPKWDGFRCLVFREDDQVELQSKSGQPLTRYFPELVEALVKLLAQQKDPEFSVARPL